ncbi:MAG: hypothetical protein ACRECN_03450 [Methylocella sp.]
MAISYGEGDLIAAIYDAIIDPSGWEEVVKRIVEATKSFSGNRLLRQADAGSLTALYNVDPVLAETYAQTHYKNDPLKAPAWSIAPGEVRACSYTQTDRFRASAYYNEFVRPQGWVDLVVTGLARAPNASALLALTRSPDAVWVEPKERHILETLAPHLRRAVAIHAQLARSRATTDSLAAAVAAAGFAVFRLTGDCKVLVANPKAEDLVRRGMGLRYERGRLARRRPLRSPIGCARSPARGRTPEGPKAISAAPLTYLAAQLGRRFSPMSSRLARTARRRSSISTGRPLPTSSSIPPPALAPKSSALPQDSG